MKTSVTMSRATTPAERTVTSMDEKISRILDSVIVPGAERSLVQLGLVRSVEREDGTVHVVLGDAALTDNVRPMIGEAVRVAIASVTGDDCVVDFTAMTTEEANSITHTVAVMSGKGGVGKSLVTGLLGVALGRAGYSVGILDADLTGPSIPKMFGVEGRPYGNAGGIIPVVSSAGKPVMSMNLLLESSDQPVIWRGPLIDKALRQFGKEVLWGRLDYLLVDLPPGTADAVLTVMQSFPIDGVVVVFTPQDLVDMIVRKAINMATMMQKRVLGVVENMSYLYVPEIDKRMELFGPSRGDEMAKTANAPLLARIPVDPSLATLCDQGRIEEYQSAVVDELGRNLLSVLGEPAGKPAS
ncbi:MAG: Mrp/NBP35 family ATP-binding protein [Dehalococcoidia bacterium]|nr:Mrp/NBP35 family ATP-binding protein [Dehalococcoidia bacterium]